MSSQQLQSRWNAERSTFPPNAILSPVTDNGVFQGRASTGWSGSAWEESITMLENVGVFQAFFIPLGGFTSVASQGEESEKHRLDNTVWNP